MQGNETTGSSWQQQLQARRKASFSMHDQLHQAACTLLRQSARWTIAAEQDLNPLIRLMHACYGYAYLVVLRSVLQDRSMAIAEECLPETSSPMTYANMEAHVRLVCFRAIDQVMHQCNVALPSSMALLAPVAQPGDTPSPWTSVRVYQDQASTAFRNRAFLEAVVYANLAAGCLWAAKDVTTDCSHWQRQQALETRVVALQDETTRYFLGICPGFSTASGPLAALAGEARSPQGIPPRRTVGGLW